MGIPPTCFCCWYFPYSCKLIEGSKVICFLEIFRLLYVGLSAIVYGAKDFSKYITTYFLIRMIYIVFVFFCYLSFLSIKAFNALNENPISNFERLHRLYTHKLFVILIWSFGFSGLVFANWIGDLGDQIIYDNGIPVSFGVALDLYFTYCLYSCYVRGIQGEFKVKPAVGRDPSQNFVISKAIEGENYRAIVAENCKEIIAHQKGFRNIEELKETHAVLIKDFTIDEMKNLNE